ncbi:MAG: TetR/AcrR family transcriptional regulator [Actinomycetia bacterium]|nr:TetR/AcrR family transcriptional regulator [Actinomycetes bacterium]
MVKPGPKRDLDAQARILRATRELIADRGPGRVTINEIAAAAGVGKQTIYRWWPTRSAVVLDALGEVVIPENPHDHGGSARDSVRDQLRRMALFLAPAWGGVVRELVAEAQSDPAVARELESRILGPARTRAAVSLRAGIDRGEVRPDLDIDVAIDVLYGPVLTRILVGNRPITLAAVDEIFDLAWRGIGVETGSESKLAVPVESRSGSYPGLGV